MTDAELRALESLRFDFTQVPEDVWKPSPYHVDELHQEVMRSIAAGVRDAAASRDASPIGVAIQGQRGAGKTHLLGMVRQRVQSEGGYFFLANPHDGAHFWESVAQSMLDGLLREVDGGDQQLAVFLRRLSSRAGMLAGTQQALVGEKPLSRRDLTSLIGALRRLSPQVGLECQDTARALVLIGADDFELQDIGHQYLQSMDEVEQGDRSTWGIRGGAKPAWRVVQDVSRLLALTGPAVIAVDQIDALIAQSAKAPTGTGDEDEARVALALEQVAGGLMELRDVTRRTLTVVSCLPESWVLIKEHAVNTAADRFREALQLHRIPDPDIGRAIVEKRFTAKFDEVGFQPPYPTWPVPPDAFRDAPAFTPRGLLQRIDAHVQACLRHGEPRELAQLLRAEQPAGAGQPQPPAPAPGALAALDTRFAELRDQADVSAALDPYTEDEAMPPLLSAALSAWLAEQGTAAAPFAQDPPPGRKPALHARLRRSLDEFTEAEAQWAFRAVASTSPRAVQCRIRQACTIAGIGEGPGATRRRLYLLRTGPWPRGRVTQEVVGAFADAGGVTLPVEEDDLRTFAALRQLLAERDPHLAAWLAERRPASGSRLLETVLADAATADDSATAGDGATDTGGASGEGVPAYERVVGVASVPQPRQPVEDPAGTVALGTAAGTGQPVRVSLASLRKHMVIFAGSGSGKTVLIRRLVEECALRGVSAIVLDPNNDLARLGDPWPQQPSGWGPGDAALAEEYLAQTDVVVWTPRREAGRPLTFQPLPDLAGVVDDGDAFAQAVDAAVAALAPRAKVDGSTSKAIQAQAVLREALRHFARRGGGQLATFIDLLADLPDGVSGLVKGDRIAADLAETLKAAMVIDPLFGGDGAPADPGQLLTPADGKRARISVISLVGLPADGQRQSFVNQLQMALFAWIRRHPAGDRPLGGLLVMDEAQTFAPSGAMTACTGSTLALASQARKYGLGLVFATQAPKGLHNRIPGNAATQLFGFLNSPTQIAAATEVARAKDSSVMDISRLSTGEFYLAGPGLPFQKVRTPLCLSHHPASPLTPEEVVARAQREYAAGTAAGVTSGAGGSGPPPG